MIALICMVSHQGSGKGKHYMSRLKMEPGNTSRQRP
jgi:hypothetical protein